MECAEEKAKGTGEGEGKGQGQGGPREVPGVTGDHHFFTEGVVSCLFYPSSIHTHQVTHQVQFAG